MASSGPSRYLARPPVSLQRMEWDREKGEVLYRTGRGHAEERGSDQQRADDVSKDVERIDEMEFLARVVTQLPEPRKLSIRYYGYYAAVVRGKRRRATAEAEASMPAAENDVAGNVEVEARGEVGGVHSVVASEPDTTERKQLRKRWAALIRRVYEVDPLLSGVRRDHADRRDHHREERHHKDPRAHQESGRSNRNGGIGPRPSPPPVPRAGARSLRQLNPRQQAGAMTGRGEVCSKRHFRTRSTPERSDSRLLHALGPSKPPTLLTGID